MISTKAINVFCFPFAGGSKYSYNLYNRHLPPMVKLIPLEYAGHGTRINEPLQYDAEVIAADMFRLLKDELDSPYIFYGHSMGALIVYLLTKRILAEGRPAPLHLFLTGCGGPSSRLHAEPKARHLLPYDAFIQELKILGGAPAGLLQDEDSMHFFIPIIRADFEAVDTYQYREPASFDIPFTVITGREDVVRPEEAERWQDETIQPVTMRQMEGDHFFIFDCAAEVMRELNDRIRNMSLIFS
jgi:surfactin synthase thioesterase subunit